MGFLDWLARMLRLPARRQLVGKSPNDPRMQKSPEELCEAIDRAEARADDLARAYAAQLNDRKSFQARLAREQQRAIDMARCRVTRELIDVSDEIERALSAAQGDQGPLAQGVRLIHADLQKRLQAIGTKRLQMVGTRFDPNLAEAVEVLPVDQPEEDEMVLEETRPGFMLGDQVVRPARVKVGRYCAPAKVASEPPASGEGSASREEAVHPEVRPAADGGDALQGAADTSVAQAGADHWATGVSPASGMAATEIPALHGPSRESASGDSEEGQQPSGGPPPIEAAGDAPAPKTAIADPQEAEPGVQRL